MCGHHPLKKHPCWAFVLVCSLDRQAWIQVARVGGGLAHLNKLKLTQSAVQKTGPVEKKRQLKIANAKTKKKKTEHSTS